MTDQVTKNEAFKTPDEIPNLIVSLLSAPATEDASRIYLWHGNACVPESHSEMEKNYNISRNVLKTKYGTASYCGDGPVCNAGKTLFHGEHRINSYACIFSYWVISNNLIVLTWDWYSDTTSIHLHAYKVDSEISLIRLIDFKDKYRYEDSEYHFTIGQEMTSDIYYISITEKIDSIDTTKDYEIPKDLYDNCPNNLYEFKQIIDKYRKNELDNKFLIPGRDGRLIREV